ncbi:peptidylprolyl isomerase [Foetidibacter luteolus]|uniref:peptidylprolyl isomerase n=1 Tax=Foetidibacter luteolus TaxID=2608880 RepID=UPI00129A5B98|nr:peptidylprolyl isomerase [Foetidibacter luteolus]
MSVIQRIRDKGAWIIFGIIALALIAFILQDGLYRKGSLFTNTSTLGKVNGTPIKKDDFDKKLALIQQTNQQAASMRQEELVAGVWNVVVNEEAMNQEYNKLGLQVSSKELGDILFGDNPPQWLVQGFTDPNTGQFNKEQARQQFAQMKKKPNDAQAIAITQAYLQPTVDQALQKKYQLLVTGAVYIPKWMSEKMNADNNAIANISYVFVPYNSISDSAIKVSDDDIKSYISKHSNQFKQEEETRSISYVSFDANPSAQDSAAVFNQLQGIKADFAAAADDKAFVSSKASTTPFFDGYVTRSTLQVPNADSITRLANGQVFGPYLDNSNYTIAKMVGSRMMPDSVKCRHILIKTEDRQQPVLADSIAKKRIDSIVTAIRNGVSFDSMVQKYSDDPGSKATKGEYDFTAAQFSGISKEFAETIFYGNVGEKKTVKVANAQYAGYHYIEVLAQRKIEPAYKIAYVSKPISVSAETDVTANNAANQFAAAARDYKKFQEASAKQNKPMLPADGIKENDFSIGTLGDNRTFVKWIYENKVGTVSEPVKINSKYVVAIITNVNEPGLQNAASARPVVENILRNEKKAQQIINTTMKGNTLEALAQSTKTTVQRADSISFQSPYISAVGNEPKMAGAAFNKSLQGKVSQPIAGTSGVFAIKGETIGARASLDGNAQTVRTSMESNLRNMIGYRALQAVREAAVVKDYRSEFY